MTDATAVAFTALASALLHSLWQDALLAVAAALVLRATARAGAAWRYGVGMAFLTMMVLVPAAQFLFCWQESTARMDAGVRPPGAIPWFGVTANVLGLESSSVVVLAWLSGVGVMLVRHVGGLRAIARIECDRHAVLPPHWQKRVDDLRRALGIARAVTVWLSNDVLIPCTARLLRPVIWLPLSLLTRMPAAQLEALLAHELAHIARKDWLWNGVQSAIESLLFFHPGVWWLGRRIRQEREHACDDLACVACGDAIALAEALTELERERHATPRLALAAGGGPLVHRVARLLSGPPTRGGRGRLAFFGVFTILGVLLIAQLGMAVGERSDLLVRASTDGPLRAGDFREIIDNRFDARRFYRASVDEQGRLSEAYWLDGHRRPIDSDVRRWIEDPRPGTLSWEVRDERLNWPDTELPRDRTKSMRSAPVQGVTQS